MNKKMIAVLIAGILLIVPVNAQDPEPIPLSYDAALRDSMDDLLAIENMEDHIDDLKDEKAMEGLRLQYGGLDIQERIETHQRIRELEWQIDEQEIHLKMLEISIEFELAKSIAEIANIKLDIEMLEAAAELEQEMLDVMKLRVEAGLNSESELRESEFRLLQNESSLASMRVNLQTGQKNLNRILQKPLDAYYWVTVEKGPVALPETLREAKDQPNIRLHDIAQKRADALPLGQERKDARETAKRERDEALRRTEAAMLTQYNNMIMLLHQNESLEAEARRAKEQYETANTNFELGLATIIDVRTAELAILRAEIDAEKNRNDFWLSRFMYENVFLHVS